MIYIHILFSLFIILISKILFSKAFGSTALNRYLPHTHLWLWQFIALCFIGANLMTFGIRNIVIDRFISSESSYIYTLWAVYYSMIMIPITVIVFNYILRFRIDKQTIAFLNKDLEYSYKDSDSRVKLFFVIISIVSIFTVIYLCYYDAPLFLFLTGRVGRISIARISYDRAFAGSSLVKNIIAQSIIPLASYIAFVYYRLSKRKDWRNIFFIICICAMFIKGAAMSKSGFAWYFLPYIFMTTIINGKIAYRNLFKIGMTILLIVLFMYNAHYANAGYGIKDILANFYGGPIGRILIGQIQSLPAYFEIFPDMHDFLLGKSIAIFNYIGLPFIEAARVVAVFLEPEGVKGGWVGVANTHFIGDAYANFGWIGFLLSPIWVALIYSFFYWKLISNRKTPLSVGLYVFILDNLTSSLTGGFFSAYVINTRVITALLFYMIIITFVAILKGQKIVTEES